MSATSDGAGDAARLNAILARDLNLRQIVPYHKSGGLNRSHYLKLAAVEEVSPLVEAVLNTFTEKVGTMSAISADDLREREGLSANHSTTPVTVQEPEQLTRSEPWRTLYALLGHLSANFRLSSSIVTFEAILP